MPFGAWASYSPGSSRPLTQKRVPSSSAGEGCTPSGCRTCQDSSFDFLRIRVSSPTVPAPRAIKAAYPDALGIPAAALSSSRDLPSRLRSGPGSRGAPDRRRGVAIGIAFNIPARRARQRLERTARDARCVPCDHVRPFPLRADLPS